MVIDSIIWVLLEKIKDTTTWVSFKKINILSLGGSVFLFIKNNLIIFF